MTKYYKGTKITNDRSLSFQSKISNFTIAIILKHKSKVLRARELYIRRLTKL